MEALFFLLIIVVIGLVFKWRSMERSIKNLQIEVSRLLDDVRRADLFKPQPKSLRQSEGQAPEDPVVGKPLADEQVADPPVDEQIAARQELEPAQARQSPDETGTEEAAFSAQDQPDFVDRIKTDWMIWLGGGCVALAGVFLAKYSIEQGLLGPVGRVSAGIFTGLALFTAAELLRRRTKESHPAFAALAGGGSITLFSVILVALHVYEMFSPATTFVLLTLVALTTMALSYVHGPALAAIGILGAYVVPVMVSTGEGNIVFVLGYSLVISISALLLLRYVYRSWLWWGFIAGALLWWGISLFYPDANGLRGWYLTALGYLILAIPGLDWRINQRVELEAENYQLLIRGKAGAEPERKLPVCFFLIVTAQAISIAIDDQITDAIYLWSPLVVLLFVAARYREHLTILPWFLFLSQCLALILARLDFDGEVFDLEPMTETDAVSLLWYLGISSLIFSVMALANLAKCRFKAIWSSLGTLAPLLLLALAYFLTSRSAVSWQWSSFTALTALIYMGLATAAIKTRSVESLVVWLFFGGHLAISLAATMILYDASLTLVLAVQIISISWIIQKFNLPGLGWLLKLIVGLVVTRLTLNPWLLGYPTDVHWSLWTFGGATLCCLVGMRLLRQMPELAKWAEAAALHLFVLTLWAEVRYWLYDGVIYSPEYTLLEAGLYIALFGSMSLVYYQRGQVSQHLNRVYIIFSQILVLMALANYLFVLLAWALGWVVGASWVWRDIGETPILNLMLLIFGVPVILGALMTRYHLPRLKKTALLFTGLSFFIFVSLQIRHLWQGSIRITLETTSGELYTYSAVWLVMAIIAILGGAWRFGEQCYRAGMILLALVIAKLFLIDMSDLEGLLRVASFMGLGLSLLGISYLHQRIQLARTL